MKVLHIIEIRGIGGAEKLLIDFLNAQKEQFTQITCVIIHLDEFFEIATHMGGQLLAIGVNVYYTNYSGPKSLWRLPYKLKTVIAEIAPAIVHTHLRLAETVLAILKFTGFKAPVVTTVHGYGDEFQNQFTSGNRTNIKYTFRFYLVRFIIKNLDTAVFISDFLRKFYINNNLVPANKKIFRVDNAINVTKYTLSFQKEKNKNKPVLILPGRLVEWKGHKFAFEAIKILTVTYPDIKLDCYGVGPGDKKLNNYITHIGLQRNIELKGFYPDIVAKIREYDIVVIPSLFESFGVVFLDAFIARVPVVAFDVPAGNEIIEHAVDGLLAKPNDAASLAKQIELLIESDGLSETIVMKAYEKVNLNYNIETMANKYKNIYLQLQNRH